MARGFGSTPKECELWKLPSRLDAAGAADFAGPLEGRMLRAGLDADFTTAGWRKPLSTLAANPVTALTSTRANKMTSAGRNVST